MELVITGRGIVSAAASSTRKLRESLVSSLIPPRARTFGTVEGTVAVPDYHPILDDGWARPRGLRTSDLFTVISCASAASALHEAGIEKDTPGTGLVFGTMFGPANASQAFMNRLLERGPIGLSPALFLDSIISMPAGVLSIHFGIRGSIAVVNGTNPLEVARLWLATGREKAIVLVATETLSTSVLKAVSRLGEIDDHGHSWPVLGQASVALVVESRHHEEHRGAHCQASILGMASGLGADKPAEGLVLSQERVAAIIRRALKSAQLAPDQLDLVCSCASGLSSFDSQEALAIAKIVPSSVRIISPKKILGDTGGASGLASLLCATLPIEEASAGCHDGQNVLVNDYSVGGQFAAVVVRVGEEPK